MAKSNHGVGYIQGNEHIVDRHVYLSASKSSGVNIHLFAEAVECYMQLFVYVVVDVEHEHMKLTGVLEMHM